MLQEIITYLIVGAAVILAAYKIYKRFAKKKSTKANFGKGKISMGHNCSDCSASGCSLRNLPKPEIKTKSNECTSNYSSK